MIGRAIASLIGVGALALTPLAVDARVLIVPDCGGGRHMLLVPEDSDDQGGEPCAKACHAMTDRRSKSAGVRKGCC